VAVTLPPLVQARTPNQSSRNGATITHLVWHATAGHYAPSIAWLQHPAAQASAHLVVREDGGEATQLVKLAVKAWHAEAWNPFSVGVEHASMGAGFASHDQLERSVRIFGWLCHHLNIPPVFGLHKSRGIVLVAVQADEHRAARVAPRPVLGRVGVRVDACFAEIDCRNEYPGASFAATSYALPPCLRVVAQSIG
jgi:hypothetical protein